MESKLLAMDEQDYNELINKINLRRHEIKKKRLLDSPEGKFRYRLNQIGGELVLGISYEEKYITDHINVLKDCITEVREIKEKSKDSDNIKLCDMYLELLQFRLYNLDDICLEIIQVHGDKVNERVFQAYDPRDINIMMAYKKIRPDIKKILENLN